MYFLVYQLTRFLLTLPTDGLPIDTLLIDFLRNDVVSIALQFSICPFLSFTKAGGKPGIFWFSFIFSL